MLLGREFHNKEGKGLKEGENVADAKGPRLDSPVTDGTQQKHPTTHTHKYCAISFL